MNVEAQHFNKIITDMNKFDFTNEPPMISSRYGVYIDGILCNKQSTEKLHVFDNLITDFKDTIRYDDILFKNFNVIVNHPGVSRNGLIIYLPFPRDGLKFHFFMIENDRSSYGKYLFHFIADISDDSLVIKPCDSFYFYKGVIAITAGYYAKDSCYWMVAEDAAMSFYSFRINNNGIDTMVITDNSELLTNFGIKNGLNNNNLIRFISQLFISNNCKYLTNSYYITTLGLWSGLYAGSFLMNFNPENGQVTFNDTIAYFKYEDSVRYGTYIGVWGIKGMAFAPNDSFLYYDIPADKKENNETVEFIIQFDLLSKERDTIKELDIYSLPDFFLANNGKIYCSTYLNESFVINNPNKKAPYCELEPLPMFSGILHSFYIFENLRTEIIFNQGCNKSYNFRVVCDTLRFKTFKWYWENDSAIGDKVKIDFSHSGKNAVILAAKTNYGYTRKHLDTIVYLKPPIALFTTDTTIGCRWLKFRFYNASVRDTVNRAVGESWFWDFGDGSSDTVKNPEHIYTKTGKYDIRLIYSNGFCYDTFEQTQAIEIIDAPRPGFAMSQSSYCSPYTLAIKDTSFGQVKTYRYDFGDKSISSLQSPTHYYAFPGYYKIYQTLTGPTGCITKDSSLLHLRPGFGGTEAINSLTANVIDKHKIKILWQAHPSATEYTVLRSLNDTDYLNMESVADTFYEDTKSDPARYVYSYKIAGMDSCGRPSAQSLKLKNILLTGKAYSNDYCILNWTAFEQWQNVVKEYVLEVMDSTGNSSVLLSTTGNNYRDDGFFEGESRFEKCYRMKAIENAGNNQTSVSNILCLPYETVLWIPSAFSPNGDGTNDTFKVKGISIKEISMFIYNRWGEKIFESHDNQSGWPGTHKGREAEAGVYYYHIIFKGIRSKGGAYSGMVHLVR